MQTPTHAQLGSSFMGSKGLRCSKQLIKGAPLAARSNFKVAARKNGVTVRAEKVRIVHQS